ncbi:DUF4861 domain-containing protein [Chryseobacterium sp. SN22]|uniref:DUF4861 family protein n=1 Tax=Chryseobacterium sp. SN22 TaxID=2606431 RepID=UPI0011F02EF6|nr:DUF4861 family protein [Chryseobacterium sp. SN22]KAA0126919.1 DUF4861 domain-containing protein [Chryseobacterium sp. SN22]
MITVKNSFLGITCAIGCIKFISAQKMVQVNNPLHFSRKEVVGIPISQLKSFLMENKEADLRMKDMKGNPLIIQWVDNNGDGKSDELLFQATVDAGKTAVYNILADPKTGIPNSEVSAYSRLVPERADDYAWENDRVAFRVYGPKGQQEALQGIKSSTLSSGVDIWLKRTELPVINKWYKGYLTDPMYYHRDSRGEGYDPYHVGNSRGTGGIGIWVNRKLQVSRNFVSSKTIAEGPLRTVFELIYQPWSDFGVKETKRISLDLGSDFSRFESDFESDRPVPNYAVGITLHKNEGEALLNDKNGYYLHWEKIDDAFVGEGLVMDPDIVEKSIVFRSDVPDESNLLVITGPHKKLVYYAGFAWQKSGRVRTKQDWENLLKKQAEIIRHPLIVKVK